MREKEIPREEIQKKKKRLGKRKKLGLFKANYYSVP